MTAIDGHIFYRAGKMFVHYSIAASVNVIW